MRDDARFANRGGNVRDAAENALRRKRAGRISGAATPFWNGIATPPLASNGASCGATVSTSHSLTQSITTSHGATCAKIVGEARGANGRVAEAAFDDEPALAQRREVPAARDERHVVSCLRELAAEIAADAAGADHRDTHGIGSRYGECVNE